ELKDRPNVLRILLCEPGGEGGFVRVVETSIDDADGEAVGEAISRLLELDGVRDVEVLHGLGKKNRPRFILRAIVEDRPGVERKVFREIFRWTGSLGARVYRCERVVADRKLVREDGVRVKRSRFEDVEHAKPEWEDVRERVGHRSSLLVRAELLARSRRRNDD
ncbi:nickel pincer cofactor biosynthesis protein LarC2, partial [Methanopyrus sp.]